MEYTRREFLRNQVDNSAKKCYYMIEGEMPETHKYIYEEGYL